MSDQASSRRKVGRLINQLLILLAVAALLWGVLQAEWQIVLIQARYL